MTRLPALSLYRVDVTAVPVFDEDDPIQLEIEDPFLKTGGTLSFLVQAESFEIAEKLAYLLFDRISGIEVQDDYMVWRETRQLSKHEIVQIPVTYIASLTAAEPARLLS